MIEDAACSDGCFRAHLSVTIVDRCDLPPIPSLGDEPGNPAPTYERVRLASSMFVPQVPQVEFVYRSPGTITDPGQPFLRNLSGGTVDMFVTDRRIDFFHTAANGQSLGIVVPAEGDMIRYHVAGAFGIATVDVASIHAGAVCRVQLQEIIDELEECDP
jgi:hypothetical protein